MDISVVIATWNNAARLRMTLRAVLNCVIPNDVRQWEIVVVNNNSTDETATVLAEFDADTRVVGVFEPRQGLSKARNAGLQAAQGKLIIFGDDDITPCRNWIGTYWRAFSDSNSPAIFGGPVVSEFEKAAPPPELLLLAPPSVKGKSFGDVLRPLTDKEVFLAANWAAPRHELMRLGGFDESLGLSGNASSVSGEEDDLQRRLRREGFQSIYLPGASIKHFVPAAKIQLRHIASRWEMHGVHLGREISNTYSGPTLGGYPRYVVRQYYQRRITAFFWRLFNTRRYLKSYLGSRQAKGILTAFAEKRTRGRPHESNSLH